MTVPGVTVDEAVERLDSALVRARAGSLEITGRSLRFKGGLFRLVSNWNILGPISTGALEVSKSEGGVSVSYSVTFTQMVIFGTGVIGGIFVPVVVTQFRGRAPVFFQVGGLAWLWLWVVGGNYLMTLGRFPRFLKRAVSRPTPR